MPSVFEVALDADNMALPFLIRLAVVYCEHAKKSGMWLISH